MSRERKYLPVPDRQQLAEERIRKLQRPRTELSMMLREYILQEVACGRSLTKICEEENMPALPAVLQLAYRDEEFSKMYARACDLRGELWAEQIMDLADDNTNDMLLMVNAKGVEIAVPNAQAIARHTLQINTRWKYLSKIMPRKFGDTSLLKIADAEGKNLPPLHFTIVPRGPLEDGSALPSGDEEEILPDDAPEDPVV